MIATADCNSINCRHTSFNSESSAEFLDEPITSAVFTSDDLELATDCLLIET